MRLPVETRGSGHLIAVLIAPENICHFKSIACGIAALNLLSKHSADMQTIEFAISAGKFKDRFLLAHFLTDSLAFI